MYHPTDRFVVMSKRKSVKGAKMLEYQKGQQVKKHKQALQKLGKNKVSSPAVSATDNPELVVTRSTAAKNKVSSPAVSTTDNPALVVTKSTEAPADSTVSVEDIPTTPAAKRNRKVLSPEQKLEGVKKKLPPDLEAHANVGDTLGSCLVDQMPSVGGAMGVYIPQGDGPSRVPKRKQTDTETARNIQQITDVLCEHMEGVRLDHQSRPIPVVLATPKFKKDGLHPSPALCSPLYSSHRHSGLIDPKEQEAIQERIAAQVYLLLLHLCLCPLVFFSTASSFLLLFFLLLCLLLPTHPLHPLASSTLLLVLLRFLLLCPSPYLLLLFLLCPPSLP
jgi:hypothetical protein